MPTEDNYADRPIFTYAQREYAEDLPKRIDKDLRHFRIRVGAMIGIALGIPVASAIKFEFMPLIFVVGLGLLFALLFEICVHSQKYHLEKYWYWFIRGSFWLLWTHELVEHKKLGKDRAYSINYDDEPLEVDSLNPTQYIKMTPMHHLVPNKKLGVALKLSIP